MKILGIDSITYGVEDLPAGIKFFEDWGLSAEERGANGAEFALPAGQRICLRASRDAALPSPVEGGSTAREVIWGVEGKDSLEEIAAALGGEREVKRDAEGVLHTRDPAGFALGFRASTPRIAARSAGATASRTNHPYEPARRASPQRIGHVVYNIEKAKHAETAAFYLDRLKFRMSDRALDLGDFMRCSGSKDHHNVFFNAARNAASFNHAAFEVSDFDEIVMGGKFIQSRGWKPATRPGRHILGANLFWYFQNPCGGNAEYYADMDVMDDNWQPRIWEKTPGFAFWMID